MTDHPVTTAVRALRAAGVAFVPHLYPYVDRGGTAASSSALGLDEHAVIKTLVFEGEDRKPFLILMHGDREVFAKALARQLGRKSVWQCTPEVAERHTGYKVGGTSPFGLARPLSVYRERSIGELSRIYINGGARGFLVELEAAALDAVLRATPVDVAI